MTSHDFNIFCRRYAEIGCIAFQFAYSESTKCLVFFFQVKKLLFCKAQMHCKSVQYSNITSPLVKNVKILGGSSQILSYSPKTWSIFNLKKARGDVMSTLLHAVPTKQGHPILILRSLFCSAMLWKNLCTRDCLILIIKCHAKKMLRNTGSNLRFFQIQFILLTVFF